MSGTARVRRLHALSGVLVDTQIALLVAHALEDDLSVLTRDVAFAAYGVRLG